MSTRSIIFDLLMLEKVLALFSYLINTCLINLIKSLSQQKINTVYVKQFSAVSLFLFLSTMACADQNYLHTSLALQQDDTDNYQIASENQQALYGEHLKPTLGYRHDNGIETFSMDIQDSIERYNKSEFNGEYPSLSLNYKDAQERSTIAFGVEGDIQSTRVSEFKDSGNIEKVSSNRSSNTATASWQYQVDPRDLIFVSGTAQAINYESKAYADLKNNSVQVTWQNSLSEQMSVYIGPSLTHYDSKYLGYFPILPQLVQGYLLCPPKTLLVSKTECASFSPELGNAINSTDSLAVQSGFKWDIQKRLKLSMGVGLANSNTSQTIILPETSVKFGPPIDEEIIFGGKHDVSSDSKLVTTNMNVNYLWETSSLELGLSRQIQPSSTGTLRKNESIQLTFKHSFSEVDSIDIDFDYESFRSLGDAVITSTTLDRDIIQGNVKYLYRLTNVLLASISLGYQQQKVIEDKTTTANALSGTLTISYTPKEWTW